MNQYKIPEPVNTDERYYHAMVVRLDALCHMMSSLMEHIAKTEGVATEEVKVVEEQPKPRKRAKAKKE